MITKRLPLEEMTLRQLRRVASDYAIPRYSRMRKSQLLDAIRSIEFSRFANAPARRLEAQEEVEAAKFNLGQENLSYGKLVSVDEGLSELPDGYGESRIVMMPRDPLWAYVYWDISNEHKESLRHKGGQQLALRVYDVTGIDPADRQVQDMQEYPCEELARDWYLPIPISDRDYLVEIGYCCADDEWLVLACSTSVHIPPVHPSEWVEEYFVEVDWSEDLSDKSIYTLNPPTYILNPVLNGSLSLEPYWNRYVVSSNQHGGEAQSHVTGSNHHFVDSMYVFSEILNEPVNSAQPVNYSSMLSPETDRHNSVSISMIKSSGTMVRPVSTSVHEVDGFARSEYSLSASAFSSVKNTNCLAFMPKLYPQKFWLEPEADLLSYGLQS